MNNKNIFMQNKIFTNKINSNVQVNSTKKDDYLLDKINHNGISLDFDIVKKKQFPVNPMKEEFYSRRKIKENKIQSVPEKNKINNQTTKKYYRNNSSININEKKRMAKINERDESKSFSKSFIDLSPNPFKIENNYLKHMNNIKKPRIASLTTNNFRISNVNNNNNFRSTNYNNKLSKTGFSNNNNKLFMRTTGFKNSKKKMQIENEESNDDYFGNHKLLKNNYSDKMAFPHLNKFYCDIANTKNQILMGNPILRDKKESNVENKNYVNYYKNLEILRKLAFKKEEESRNYFPFSNNFN